MLRRLIAIVSVVSALLGIWLGLRPGLDVDGARSAPSPTAAAPTARPRPSVPRWDPSARTAPDVSPATVLAMFKEWSKYPPNSRPLHEGMVDVTEPHMVHVAEQRLSTVGPEGKPKPSAHACLLQPHLHNVAEGQLQRITLRCAPAQDKPDPRQAPGAVQVHVRALTLTGQSGQRRFTVPVGGSFRDDGREGDSAAADHEYTLQVALSEAGEFNLQVTIEIPAEGTGATYTLNAPFEGTPAAPARFTSRLFERLEQGSLVIDVEIDVAKPGRYRLFGNLLSGETFVAYAKRDITLAQGTHRVPLLFFGKIFHDAQAEGSFTLVEVRGRRLNVGAEADRDAPLMDAIPPLPAPYRTASYSLDQFSPQEWDAPYKRERIAELERRVRDMQP